MSEVKIVMPAAHLGHGKHHEHDHGKGHGKGHGKQGEVPHHG